MSYFSGFVYDPDFEDARDPFSIQKIEWTEYCYHCDGKHIFIADRLAANGLVGKCSNCEDERVAPWTRTNSEAA